MNETRELIEKRDVEKNTTLKIRVALVAGLYLGYKLGKWVNTKPAVFIFTQNA